MYEEFKKRVAEGEDSKNVLDELGLERYCCRAIFLGHFDLLPLTSQFKKA